MRRSVNPIPNPDPNPTQAPQMSLKEAWPRQVCAHRETCVWSMCRGTFYYTYIYSQKGLPCEVADLVGVLVVETIHPSCMCAGGGRGGERGWRAFYHTYIYSQKGRPCEGADLVGVLVAETIHPACMCEGGGRGGERGGRAFYHTYIYS